MLPCPLPVPVVPAAATSVAALESGRWKVAARLDGLRVGEVVQAVAALAIYPRAWAEVGGQPVP